MLVSDDVALERIVRELLATMLPSALVTTTPLVDAPASNADVAIVDQSVRGLKEVTAAQELRARGFRGGIAFLSPACDPALQHRLDALGPARCVARETMATTLPAAIAELSARPDLGAELSARPDLGAELGPIERELRRTQQLVAMGEATSRIQHTLNNPLTALLAEAQLLEMEELSEQHRAAVRRMIELCRRLVVMVRGLDSGTG